MKKFFDIILASPFNLLFFYVLNVRVSVSNQFFGWVFGLGDGIKILGPENVKKKMKEEIEKIQKYYF